MDWYFDFVSPYAYLQFERHYDSLAELKPRAKPVLLAALLDHWGQRGPGEIVPKRTFTYRQTQWIAKRDGVPLRYPPRHPFNSLRVLRLAVALDCDLAAIRAIFRAIWRDGGDVDSAQFWSALAHDLRIADIDARTSAQPVKDQLRRNGEEAIAAGVFGVPTIAIDGLLFWGYDATAMAMDHLRDPMTFRTDEMRRLDALPVGATRTIRGDASPPDGSRKS